VKEEPVVLKKAEEPVAVEEKPAAPVVEETILAAKPGWEAPKAKKQNREPRREKKAARPAAQLQEGDGVIIGTPVLPKKEVVLTPAAADDEKAAKIAAFLSGLMEHMEVEATPEVFTTEEGGYKVILQGENLGAIIGRRGETLDAIQQLTNYSVNHGQSKRARIHIDAEGYRAKREESLQRLAVKIAGKVVKYRKNMTLEAMNAYERHVIHTALQDTPYVTTFSIGTEPNRRVVVSYDRTKQ
jgi:spoIIIJ-associated protein